MGTIKKKVLMYFAPEGKLLIEKKTKNANYLTLLQEKRHLYYSRNILKMAILGKKTIINGGSSIPF